MKTLKSMDCISIFENWLRLNEHRFDGHVIEKENILAEKIHKSVIADSNQKLSVRFK